MQSLVIVIMTYLWRHVCSKREIYKVTIDLLGTLYCGITLKWDYNKRHINVSMHGYIECMLQEYLNVAV